MCANTNLKSVSSLNRYQISDNNYYRIDIGKSNSQEMNLPIVMKIFESPETCYMKFYYLCRPNVLFPGVEYDVFPVIPAKTRLKFLQKDFFH